MRKRFFLSHSTEDNSLVLPVDHILKSLGLRVWTDKYEISVGDSLIDKVFDQGISKTDYLCVFLTKASIRSRWVRKELSVAFNRSMREGKPKILVLRFDDVDVPLYLSDERYATLKRHEISDIVQTILKSANIRRMSKSVDGPPFERLDFHDAVKENGSVYLLGSRKDELDHNPFYDPEGVEFLRRHVFVLRVDNTNHEVRYHYLSKARPAHTAMRVIEGNLLVFINDKVLNQEFSMTGRLFSLHWDTMRANAVSNVFEGENWGWSPFIDESGLVHHKDSARRGNPYMVGQSELPGKDWHELVKRSEQWKQETCPFDVRSGPSRETGYLRFLQVDPHIFKDVVIIREP